MAAAVAAMEQSLRRLDAALASRAASYRALGEQHGQLSLELRQTAEALQTARAEADGLRERADLVDALRAELAAMQAEREQAPAMAAEMPTAPVVDSGAADEIAALKAELAECRAYEADLLQRLDAIMARLRQALAEPAQ